MSRQALSIAKERNAMGNCCLAFVVLIATLGICDCSDECLADVGDIVAVVSPQPSGVQGVCAIGLAFDGQSLYVDRCGDFNIYRISPTNGSLLETIPFDDPEGKYIPERPAALAYDSTRIGLWIGTQKGKGESGFNGCGNIGMPIYFWRFADDSVTEMFVVPLDLTNSETGQGFLRTCHIQGLAYRQSDDEVWIADERNRNLGAFRPDGTLVAGFDALDVDFGLLSTTGIAWAGDVAYLATGCTAGCGDVFRATRAEGELLSLGQFIDGSRWEADMECDATTFAPVHVMWVRSNPQGVPANDFLTAYEVEPGSCGAGPPIGACCDPNKAPCRNTPESQCQGPDEVWTEGVLCAELDPPCHEMHRIILLDRTGSMQAPFDQTTTKCEQARRVAKSDVESFFGKYPSGSSVAVWTFAGSEPMPLTNGFVDKLTALTALGQLEGVNCTNLTPLAESLCEAVDMLVATFPTAVEGSREIAVSTDGFENNSDGPCAGPSSGPPGDKCGEFDPASWQQRVCDHVVGNAVFLARFWGDLTSGFVASMVDGETGNLRGGGVSDTVFLQALAEATGGTFTFIDDFPPLPSGSPAFGVAGACCLPGGTCQEPITESECAVLGGTHQGENSTCPNAAGACCLSDRTCQDAITQTACTGQSGTFQGTSTTCEAHVAGACCLPNETCQDGMTPGECAVQNGTHQGGCTVCTGTPGECPAPIPAVSAWGVIVMSLLVMVGGTIVLGQRRGAEVLR